MEVTPQSVWADVQAIRTQAPLIHNITNFVAMNNSANALLSIGASPVMAHAVEEVDDFVTIASALVINIGTLRAPWVAGMQAAVTKARQLQKPIILDPVGAGATPYRNQVLAALLQAANPTIIRGNASEIRSLAGFSGTTKGVDSTERSDAVTEMAVALSRKYDCVVCVSGATDYVIKNDALTTVHNGHPMMTKVTALGCTASALCGAFAAVNSDYVAATAHAMVVMGIAGEMAADRSPGPGSLQLHFLDALYTLSETDIEQLLTVAADGT